MIILRKKRLVFVICAMCLSLIIPIASLQSTSSIETVALPTTNKTIILDAGHGYPDKGASSNNDVTESSINLQITFKLKKLLESIGAKVILTRSDENGIYESNARTIREMKISDLKQRVKMANTSNADAFISIHLNKISESQYYGWQTFYKTDYPESKFLAKSIQSKLNETIQKENNRESLSISNVYLIKNVSIPISIVECGFLSNPEEEKLLQTEEYQSKLALGIFLGIVEYFTNYK